MGPSMEHNRTPQRLHKYVIINHNSLGLLAAPTFSNDTYHKLSDLDFACSSFTLFSKIVSNYKEDTSSLLRSNHSTPFLNEADWRTWTFFRTKLGILSGIWFFKYEDQLRTFVSACYFFFFVVNVHWSAGVFLWDIELFLYDLYHNGDDDFTIFILIELL